MAVVLEEKNGGKQCFELYGVRVLEHHGVLKIKPGTSVTAEFQVFRT